MLPEHPEFATYEAYLQIQSRYVGMYRQLELQYESCKCFSCRMKVITFGLELLALNSFIDQLEAEVVPGIGDILEELKIDHKLSDNGQTELIN
jgi:hypothetical protein